MGTREPISTLDDYRRRLRIEKHQLDDELELQAELLHSISEHVVSAKSRALHAKDHLERTEGDIYSDAKQDNPKATVPELQGITLRDPDRIKAFDLYQRARESQESWEGLHEAWRSRGFALRALVDLRLASYYTSDSSAADGRKALNQARQAAQQHSSTPRRRSVV